MFNGGEEAILFLLEDVRYPLFTTDELGIGASHLGDKVGHQPVEEGGACPQFVTMADGTADDAAQHVPAPFVAGDDAIGDQEGAGSDVIRQNAQRRTGHVGIAGFACGRFDQIRQQVNVVVAVHVLQHGRDPLQAHPGIDRGLGQLVHDARLVAVELHEHVVPDLDVAIAILVGRSGRAAGNMLAVIVEDLGTRTAGAGITHHPEVVGRVACALVVTDAHDALGRHANGFVPDLVGFVILGIHRHPQAFGRQLVDIG